MAVTASAMAPLGTAAPDFALPDVVSGKTVRLSDFASRRVLVVLFLCRHCPYVQHVKKELTKLGVDYAGQDVAIVAISANDADAYPDDSPEGLKEMAKSLCLVFPLCYDESQATAKAYTATCTPDFFVFDAARRLVYRGRLDGSRPGNDVPVTGRDLRAAIDSVLAGKAVSRRQSPSMGCNIKWKPGNEPDYAR
jgi:peroxiredoxin